MAGLSEYAPDGTCSAVVDALARAGARSGRPATTASARSAPNGTYVVGIDPEADGYGSPTITVLDAATGEEVVTFEAALPRRTVGGFCDPDGLGRRRGARGQAVSSGTSTYMMRLGLDGSVQRIGIPSAGVSGLTVAVPS